MKLNEVQLFTSEQKRIRLAELLGCINIRMYLGTLAGEPMDYLVGEVPPSKVMLRIPYYDLSLLHHIEEQQLRAEDCYKYNHLIAEQMGAWEPSRGPANWPFHASADQRINALIVMLSERNETARSNQTNAPTEE